MILAAISASGHGECCRRKTCAGRTQATRGLTVGIPGGAPRCPRVGEACVRAPSIRIAAPLQRPRVRLVRAIALQVDGHGVNPASDHDSSDAAPHVDDAFGLFSGSLSLWERLRREAAPRVGQFREDGHRMTSVGVA